MSHTVKGMRHFCLNFLELKNNEFSYLLSLNYNLYFFFFCAFSYFFKKSDSSSQRFSKIPFILLI